MHTSTGQEALPVGELIMSNAEVASQTIVNGVAERFFPPTWTRLPLIEEEGR